MKGQEMAITIPVDNVESTPKINMEEFRMRVADFAAALWQKMVDAETAKDKHSEIKHHTSDRISALSLKGGEKVSTDIDELEAIYLEKYA